ncbi:MAG: hypothetical protein JO072_02665 [Parafilimonas sp.]|nr:hypothetical protein [Parafilimonas sp.]
MKKIIGYALLFAIAGCSKDVTTDRLSANSTGNAAASVSVTYLPLTKGTYWKYNEVTESGGTSTTEKYTDKVLSKQSTINGKVYTATTLSSATTTDTVYYCQQNHDYYQYSNINVNGVGVIPTEVLFLKDNVAKGTEWSAPAGSLFGFPATGNGTIIKKNYSLTIHGETYNNVIHTQVSLSVLYIGNIGTIDYYVAQGVGIIKMVTNVTYGTAYITTSTLNKYQVN